MNSTISRAEAFARKRHEGQTRKGAAQEPYINHVEDVARLTRKFGGNDDEVCAAWLHDTVEDCPPTSVEEIARAFSPEIASIVQELTDNKSLPKAERKRQQVVNAPHKSKSAALVKLADKSSNLFSLAHSPSPNWDYDRRMEYLRWAKEVVFALPSHPTIGLDHFNNACTTAEACIKEEFSK
ncbi:MAG: phosphohydrolase [Rhodobacteraceae bacterium]|nr:MAG: phosphohydrolase [Paracoccaceae bacterium]